MLPEKWKQAEEVKERAAERKGKCWPQTLISEYCITGNLSCSPRYVFHPCPFCFVALMKMYWIIKSLGGLCAFSFCSISTNGNNNTAAKLKKHTSHPLLLGHQTTFGFCDPTNSPSCCPSGAEVASRVPVIYLSLY